MQPSRSTFAARFAMVDYARGNCFRESYLCELLETAARLGLSGLSVYLEDLALFIAPEIYKGSIPLAGWKRLDARARSLGLTLLPLLNFYGHNEQTLAHPEFASFRDDAAGTALNLDAPEVKAAVELALDVVLETFSSPLIHIGFDETFGLGQAEEAQTGKPVNVGDVYARHLKWVAGEVIRRGRRPMFWADMAGVYYPEIIPDLPRELIPVDWFYRNEPEYPTMRRWIEAGFDLWVAPTIGYSETIWPDSEGLQTHARAVLSAGLEAGAQGVIFTAWEQSAFPFSSRLPLLAWESAVSLGEADQSSLEEITAAWLRPILGKQAEAYSVTSLRLGRLNRLLPIEYCLGNPMEIRREWYRCNPKARQIHAEMLQLLEETAEIARAFHDLSLTHRRFSLLVATLSSGVIAPDELLAEARTIEPLVEQAWGAERTQEGFELAFRPVWRRWCNALERWPEDQTCPMGTYVPEVLRAADFFQPSQPLIRGFFKLRSWQQEKGSKDDATQVWIWSNGAALSFRFHCLQEKKPRGVEQSVDFVLTRDDSVALCLDFEGAGREFLWIEVNPAGTVFTQWHYGVEMNSEWHPLAGRKGWGTPVSVPGGWGVELVIPYADLGICRPLEGAEMGVAFSRRRSWGHAPISYWGGMGWRERNAPECLPRLKF